MLHATRSPGPELQLVGVLGNQQGCAPPYAGMYTNGSSRNVLGGPLQVCCTAPQTGFYRDGYCHTGPEDQGVHVVCAEVTQDFLAYSRERGNDLITPRPQWGFPGLKPGDGWCLCAARWLEAYHAGVAPPVKLAATHSRALDIVAWEFLLEYALDAPAEN